MSNEYKDWLIDEVQERVSEFVDTIDSYEPYFDPSSNGYIFHGRIWSESAAEEIKVTIKISIDKKINSYSID